MSLEKIKKGDTVILKSFTGIKLGVFDVTKATKEEISIERKNGLVMIFDRETGKQKNPEKGKENYASSIVENDGSYVAPKRGRRKRKRK